MRAGPRPRGSRQVRGPRRLRLEGPQAGARPAPSRRPAAAASTCWPAPSSTGSPAAFSVHHLTTLGRELEALGIDLVVLISRSTRAHPRAGSSSTCSAASRSLSVISAGSGPSPACARPSVAGSRSDDLESQRQPTVWPSRPSAPDGATVTDLAQRLCVSRATVGRLLAAEGLSKRVAAGEPKTAGISQGEIGA